MLDLGCIILPNDDFIFRTILVISFGITYFFTEALGLFNLPYSKFTVTSKGIPSRTGWSIIYCIAITTHIICFILYLITGGYFNYYHGAYFLANLVHFLRRLFESLFIHKYSAAMDWKVVINVSLVYFAIGASAWFWIIPIRSHELIDSILSRPYFWIGLVICPVGQFINSYHHYLLSALRKEGELRYKVPYGGLFEYVSCPHYLGELLTFFGFALITSHLILYIHLAVIAVFLIGRSYNTTQWYRQKIRESYPKNRKHIIPFIF